jgi:hypothetical protein
MAAVEATAADADVERVEGDRLDRDQDLAAAGLRLVEVGHLRRRRKRADQSAPHSVAGAYRRDPCNQEIMSA